MSCSSLWLKGSDCNFFHHCRCTLHVSVWWWRPLCTTKTILQSALFCISALSGKEKAFRHNHTLLTFYTVALFSPTTLFLISYSFLATASGNDSKWRGWKRVVKSDTWDATAAKKTHFLLFANVSSLPFDRGNAANIYMLMIH